MLPTSSSASKRTCAKRFSPTRARCSLRGAPAAIPAVQGWSSAGWYLLQVACGPVVCLQAGSWGSARSVRYKHVAHAPHGLDVAGAAASTSTSLRRRETLHVQAAVKRLELTAACQQASFSRDSGWRGWRTRALSMANSPGQGQLFTIALQGAGAQVEGEGAEGDHLVVARGAPGASCAGRRRSTAWMRASSSRGLKGLPR